MRQWIHIGAVVFCVVLAACSGDKPKELLETAQLEERQHNVAHGLLLYAKINCRVGKRKCKMYQAESYITHIIHDGSSRNRAVATRDRSAEREGGILETVC